MYAPSQNHETMRLRTKATRANEDTVRVRQAAREDIPGIVLVSNSSIRPNEGIGFGGGTDSPFHETTMLSSDWREPNFVRGEEVLVAEMEGRIVGCATITDKGTELELVNIDVPLDLQGRGIGSRMVRSIEVRARKEGKQAVTLGTSRNAQGVAWKSLSWWQHLGYKITHEEENEWTRSMGPGAREIRMRKDLK